MNPICFRLGPLTVHWYGVMMAMGFMAALAACHVLSRREGRSFEFLSDLIFWLMVAGIVGARATYVASEWKRFLAHPAEIVRVDQGGLIYYGGFLACAGVILALARRNRERFWGLADLALSCVPLAHALGRVGCFMNGCCYGTPTNGVLGVRYPMESPAWYDDLDAGLIPRFHAKTLAHHPVQLYEAALDLLIFAILFAVYRSPRRKEGVPSGLYFVLYALTRFSLEFFRGDERWRWFGLSVAQWVSAALLVLGVWLLARAASGRAPDPSFRRS